MAFIALIMLLGLVIALRPGLVCDAFGWGCEEARARQCLLSTGGTTEFSPSLSASENSISFHLGGKEVIIGADNEAKLKLIMQCMLKDQPKNDFVTPQAIQLGLVEDQWKDGEVTIDLFEPTETEARDHLMNLAFGPAGGLRTEIMDEWCDVNKSCVRCQKSSADEMYRIEVIPDATFTKVYSGTAPLAGDRHTPYQLVEADEELKDGIGRRVLFICSK